MKKSDDGFSFMKRKKNRGKKNRRKLFKKSR